MVASVVDVAFVPPSDSIRVRQNLGIAADDLTCLHRFSKDHNARCE
jgi:hypothetical protein